MEGNEQSEAVAGRADLLEVQGGVFEPLPLGRVRDRAMVLTVLGRNIHKRGSPLLARVGAQPVLEIIISPGGGAFSGLLASVPNDGDRLFVGYAGYGEMTTNVVFRSPSTHREMPVT